MLRRNKRSNETVRLKGKRNHLANRKQRKIQKDLFPIGLCWGREPIFSKKTCFITGSSHFYLWWSDIQHLWGLSLCKTFWIMLRQASLWVAGQWPLFFFPSGSLFSWALLMHEYEQPWKAFCLCHKKKISLLTLGILDSPVKEPFTLIIHFIYSESGKVWWLETRAFSMSGPG